MSAIGIVNLAERLLNQGSTQGQDLPAPQATANAAAQESATAVAEDQFTPAQGGQAQTAAQDAGLFSVTQFAFFSAAADFLLGQAAAQQPVAAAGGGARGTGQTTQVAAPTLLSLNAVPPIIIKSIGPLAAGTAANPGNTGNTANATGAAEALVAANAGNAPVVDGATTTTAVPANAAGGAAAVQQQIQTLNASLAALGLTPQEIQELDQIASIINNFDPAAFTALAYQLEQIAQAQAPQTTATKVNGNAQPAATNGTANANGLTNGNAANTNGSANQNGFQVHELVIRFSGAQVQAGSGKGTATQGAAATGNTNVRAAAFQLQIEEVNLTLTNGTGQNAQAHAIVRHANARNANGAAPKARAAQA